MDEINPVPVPAEGPAAAAAVPQAAPAATTLGTWMREGLRTAIFLKPRVTGEPTPAQFAVMLLLAVGASIALARLEVAGSANFNVSGWLGPWWSVGASLLLAWSLFWKLPRDDSGERPTSLVSWYALWIMGDVPLMVISQALMALQVHEALPAAVTASPVFTWGTWVGLMAWMVAVPVVLGRHFGLRAPRLVALAVGILAIQWITATYFYQRPWYSDEPYDDERPRLSLSQESFEKQQEVWQKAVASLARERPDVRDVYGVVFAPYAGEDVFLRESTMVAEVLAQRFDAEGRVLHLVNHATTSDQLPWATPLNLQRAVQAIAQRMDPERDVLVVYLTSHGARNFRLSASHWPLKVDGIAPAELRRALDDAGIRNRVIAVSACYSGGWIAPLANDTSLVMTAADPDHTSYGCGRLSELTYFGRAMFDEQLRGTHSFEQAFAAAVPLIKQREEEAGKSDGFSNPQISVGEKIRPVLAELEQRLDRTPGP